MLCTLQFVERLYIDALFCINLFDRFTIKFS